MEATSSADASRAPSGWEDNTAPSRGPEDRRDGADGRALGSPPPASPGRRRRHGLGWTAPDVGRAGEAPFRRTPQRHNRLTRWHRPPSTRNAVPWPGPSPERS